MVTLNKIGWRGFGRESVNYGNFGWSCLNFVYPLFVVSLLLYTYVYEIVACQWKLNVQKDTQILTTTTVATTIASQNVTPWIPWITFKPAKFIMKNLTHAPDNSPPEACEHIMTTYIIPNILHFIAYCMGMYHFRIQENEQLYSLMEKVN
ncbi:hypothetical protein KUTeg_008985 [Tegillarca granosa]|uniref:Uncharacterized protein n=1 Tax=Tegillarca granosa TaxID=220873 RepID=A0ABQ9F7X0_TEGGR|nr:hypothetical protein KUTeg_008985 [Tegillarca granosa]